MATPARSEEPEDSGILISLNGSPVKLNLGISGLTNKKERQMVGIYIMLAIIAVGIGALVFYKIKWARSDNAQARGRAAKIEEQRVK